MIQGGIGINQIAGVRVVRVVEICQEAERLGYGKCWVADQGLDTRDVFVTLTAIAQRTTSIRMGPGITNPYTRHPAVTAAGIASLDELSGGRAFHGVGAGGLDTLYPLGLTHQRPVAAVREMIGVTRALYRGEAVTFHGQTIQLREACLEYARPDVEIWLAGRGDRMLTLGGELADGVMLGFIHKEMLQDYVDLVRAGAARSGGNPRICYWAMMITSEQLLEQIRPHLYYLLADSPPRVHQLLGITPADLETIHQTVIEEGLAAAGKLIKDEWVRPFAIMGSVAECVAELTHLMTRYGMDEFLLPLLDMETAPQLMAQVAAALARA